MQRIRAIHSLTAKFNQIRSSARSRGIEFNLTEAQYIDCGYDCYYCGSNSYGGLDRVDSDNGYVKGNIVACCSRCNYMKNDMSQDSFYEHVTRICAHKKIGG